MTIDRSHIGHVFPPRIVEVEAGQLRLFAKATGETNPIYFDLSAAIEAGHPALPAPPTFLFSLDLLSDVLPTTLGLLGVDVGKILHGEQHFEQGAQIYAGDRLTLTTHITDIYDKKGGALELFAQQTNGINQHGQAIGVSRSVTVVRQG
jgi:acyl dehydratase